MNFVRLRIKVRLILLAVIFCFAPFSVFGSTYTATPPSVDGIVATGEWDSAEITTLQQGVCMMQHDNVNLYVLIDLTSDTGNDAYPGDYFNLSFDTNLDGLITPNVDVNFGHPSGSNYNTLCLQYYLAADTWTSCSTPLNSSVAGGFGTSVNSGTSHRFWELAIARTDINAQSASQVAFGVDTFSATPFLMGTNPTGYTADFSNLMTSNLASAPAAIPTLSEWGMIVLMMLLGITTFIYMRKSRSMFPANP